jgi:hypothetical protein
LIEISITDETVLDRIDAVLPLMSEVMREDVNRGDAVIILLGFALDSVIPLLLGNADAVVLMQTIQAFAAKYPHEIYGAVVEMLRAGIASGDADTFRRQPMGFRGSGQSSDETPRTQ